MLNTLKSRFKYIVVLYDNDLAGIHNMRKIKKSHPELLYFWIPRHYEAKDISDFRKKYGEKETYNFIKTNILKYVELDYICRTLIGNDKLWHAILILDKLDETLIYRTV